MKTKALILHDRVSTPAPPDEQDTIRQVEVVSETLSHLGYEPVCLPFDSNLPGVISRIKAEAPAFAFNLVESVQGQGRLVHLAPTLLDFLGIPYTGARAETILITSNKLLAKRFLQGAGIATPAWYSSRGLQKPGEFVEARYIVKSLWEHASIGLEDDSVFTPASYGEIVQRLEARRKSAHGDWFAEAFVEGREFNLSILSGDAGPQVLPPAEILFSNYEAGKPRIVGYAAKWHPDSFEYGNTPRRFDFDAADLPLLARLESLARACWRAFDLRGYARVDMRVDYAGCPWVLEVNANPCLSPDAGFPAALERAGIPFHNAIERMVLASLPKPGPRSIDPGRTARGL